MDCNTLDVFPELGPWLNVFFEMHTNYRSVSLYLGNKTYKDCGGSSSSINKGTRLTHQEGGCIASSSINPRYQRDLASCVWRTMPTVVTLHRSPKGCQGTRWRGTLAKHVADLLLPDQFTSDRCHLGAVGRGGGTSLQKITTACPRTAAPQLRSLAV